jgi:NADPH:quinone reductase
VAHAIRFHATGGPEVMQWEETVVGEPGPGQARVRNTAIGVNFIDTYHRSGLYPLTLPSGLGNEAAGVVQAVGSGVDWIKPGDRVASGTGPLGAYSTERIVPADRLVKLPDTIDDRTAAAIMLKGLTTQYLLRQTVPLKGGETILFHAAAGGVGLIACEWARALGVTMIGTVGSEAKAKLAREHGCAHTIVYTKENFVERVKEITGGKGVDVVYDGVGKDTFPASLDCLKPLKTFVSFGNASGPVPPFNIALLAQKGSLYATRPTLVNYAADRQSLNAMASDLFGMVQSGKIKPDIGQTFALKDAADAHRALQSRQTTGSTLLLP